MSPPLSRLTRRPALTLAFAGPVTIGAIAMALCALFSVLKGRTTGWAHRGSQAV